jgi:hypothetical protein
MYLYPDAKPRPLLERKDEYTFFQKVEANQMTTNGKDLSPTPIPPVDFGEIKGQKIIVVTLEETLYQVFVSKTFARAVSFQSLASLLENIRKATSAVALSEGNKI